jgi:hypothetical protein
MEINPDVTQSPNALMSKKPATNPRTTARGHRPGRPDAGVGIYQSGKRPGR